ncbi:MAG: N-acetylmuramoyl-L-alanine amidase [Rhodospirillales bacterium]|nr:N-acetylmuramoyl-L-alanine amidase [Rhodospirillales bacterium]
MITELTSPNCDERPADSAVDMLVLHYTGMETAAAALARLTDPNAKVSAHYLIDEEGAVFRLVDEERRAWHAGVSFWRGATDINAHSIGVELANPGHEFGYRPFPRPQMAALVDVARGILGRWPIPARNVVGHADVAPRRKMDPGELFDWPALARAGIGLWPAEADECVLDEEAIRALLAEIGYETTSLFATLKAFQRHFRPERVNGRIDWQTARLARGLCTLVAGEAGS